MTSSIAATVILVAPPTLMRLGLLTALQQARPSLVIHVTTNSYELPDELRELQPALVILDAALGNLTPNEAATLVPLLAPDQSLLVIGQRRGTAHLARLLKTRPTSCLLVGTVTPEELVAAVDKLLTAPPSPAFSPTAPAEPLGVYARRRVAEPITHFSRRELEVLRLVAGDRTNHEIADQLAISIRTVEAHRRLLLEKGGARSMVGLVLQAVRLGWLRA